ncbi:hypothetical protein C1645_811137 [Glomus cerebriforme]|uniref:Uncharacterized protein n=1 Tax=Glomus cerebriforme TaxID=658196 RepID=A0A397TQQ9_9GLOM|nr:hypothetical protein C1645_811137 [Glomus cerebriforme]
MTDIEIRAVLKEIFADGIDTVRKKPNITRESLDKLVYAEAVICQHNNLNLHTTSSSCNYAANSFDTEIGGCKITDVSTNVLKIHNHEAR